MVYFSILQKVVRLPKSRRRRAPSDTSQENDVAAWRGDPEITERRSKVAQRRHVVDAIRLALMLRGLRNRVASFYYAALRMRNSAPLGGLSGGGS